MTVNLRRGTQRTLGRRAGGNLGHHDAYRRNQPGGRPFGGTTEHRFRGEVRSGAHDQSRGGTEQRAGAHRDDE